MKRTSLGVIAACGAVALALAWVLFLRAPAPTSQTGVALGQTLDGAKPGDLNVIVITLDTTRWDRLGAYGAPAPRRRTSIGSPVRACCSSRPSRVAPLTLPAHSTLFTEPAAAPARRPRQRRLRSRPEAVTLAVRAARDAGCRHRRLRRAHSCSIRSGASTRGSTPTTTSSMSRVQVHVARRTSRGAPMKSSTTRCPGWSSTRADGSSPGCTSTTPTRRTIRPSRSSRGSARTPYAGEIAFVDQQVGRVLQWLDARGLARPDDRRRDRRSRREPERASAKARTGCSSTTPPRACHSSSGRRSRR